MKADIWGQSLPTCFLVQPFLSLLFPSGQLHAVQLCSLHVHRYFTSGLHRICSQLKFSRKFCLKNETTHLRILSVPEKNKTKQIQGKLFSLGDHENLSWQKIWRPIFWVWGIQSQWKKLYRSKCRGVFSQQIYINYILCST